MYWVSYKKGSFWLKEKFACRNAAAVRKEVLAEDVSFIEIIEGGAEKRAFELCSALELDPATNSLIFISRKPLGDALTGSR